MAAWERAVFVATNQRLKSGSEQPPLEKQQEEDEA